MLAEIHPTQPTRRPWQAMVSDLLAERNVSCEKSIVYGPHPRQCLDVYRPQAGRGPERRPVVLFIYGGGWTSGERGCYSFVGSALAARGITTVVADYRMFPEVRFPDFNWDAAGAYAWTARNLAVEGGRPIIVMGHSAGAHIAALIAYDRSYLRGQGPDLTAPAGLIAMSGPYAFDPTTWPTTKEIFATSAGSPDAARPIAHIGGHCPATLLIYGLRDDVVQPENGRELAATLTDHGVAARLIEYRNLGHIGPITSLLRLSRWRAPVLEECVAFVDQIAASTVAV